VWCGLKNRVGIVVGVVGEQGSGAVPLAARRTDSSRQAKTQEDTVTGRPLVCTAEVGGGEWAETEFVVAGPCQRIVASYDTGVVKVQP